MPNIPKHSKTFRNIQTIGRKCSIKIATIQKLQKTLQNTINTLTKENNNKS